MVKGAKRAFIPALLWAAAAGAYADEAAPAGRPEAAAEEARRRTQREFLQIQDEIGRLQAEGDDAACGKADAPAPAESHAQRMRFVKARLEHFAAAAEAKRRRSEKLLRENPWLQERISEKGLLFDGERWTDAPTHCGRIARLCSAAYELKQSGAKLEARILQSQRSAQIKGDGGTVSAFESRSDGSAAHIDDRDIEGDKSLSVKDKAKLRAERDAYRQGEADRAAQAQQAGRARSLRREENRLDELQRLVTTRLGPLLKVKGIQEVLSECGYYEVDGFWFKS